MPIDTSGSATGTMDPVEIKYLGWDPKASPVSIHMHPGVAEGIADDAAKNIGMPSREVGGLLLGRVVAGARPAVWIERYQQISCQHRFGPQFILDREEIKALEEAATSVLDAGELAVVGLYRSHTRPGFQLEESDFELIRRYFSDASDLILLIRPKNERNISGQFLVWDKGHGAHPVGEEITFRESTAHPDPIPNPVPEATAPKAEAPAPVREYPRRLVPDFIPSPVEPAPSLYGLGQNFIPEETTKEHESREPFKKWLPLLAALLLVGGIVWLLLQPGRHGSSNPANPVPAQTAQAERPLGLYVDPAGQNWRVVWNPSATALHDARNVQLFVREKDDLNMIPLSDRDRASGSYQYRPTGNDVTFRLEVVDKAGRVSAESFRIMQAPGAPVPAASEPAPAPDTGGRITPPQITPPKAVYKAPPVVAAGVRSRIKGTVGIDVRVQIDTRGHVVSATPVTKQRSGLDEYLANRAVQAAKLWRFEPGRENGKPVAGIQILHFVFEK
jgi:hypothetical protein